MQQRVTTREGGYFRIIALLIITLAFFLRARSLDCRSLWFDEAVEYWVATAPLPQLLQTVRMGLQDPPLFSLLLHFWMILGRQEFLLRYLSLMFSVLSVAGLMFLGRRLWGRRAGVIVGMLMTISSPQVRFAQEVGQYALMGCALILNLVALEQALHRASEKWWWIWSGTEVFCLCSYYGTAIPLAAVGLLVFIELICKRQGPMLRRFVLSGTVGVAVALLLLFVFLPAQLFRGPTTSAFQGSFGNLLSELTRFARASRWLIQFQVMSYQPGGFPWPAVLQWSVWLPIVMTLLFALFGFLCHQDANRRPVLWLLGAWLLHYIASKFNLFPFGFRYSLVITPLLLLTVTYGIWCAGRVHWTLGAGMLIWILGVSVLSPPEPQEDLRAVTRFWMEHRVESEITYVYYGAVPAFRYYLGQSSMESASSSPSPLWYGACWRGESLCPNGGGIFYGSWFRHLEPDAKVEAIEHTLGAWPQRLWLIFSHIYPDENQQILDLLEEMGYSRALSNVGENTSAYLLERK